jgi:hypothetical protein
VQIGMTPLWLGGVGPRLGGIGLSLRLPVRRRDRSATC